MQFEFKAFYVIKARYCFQSWLALQTYECQDDKDTVDLRLCMLLRLELYSERMFKWYFKVQGQRWNFCQKFLIPYFIKPSTRVVTKHTGILPPAPGDSEGKRQVCGAERGSLSTCAAPSASASTPSLSIFTHKGHKATFRNKCSPWGRLKKKECEKPSRGSAFKPAGTWGPRRICLERNRSPWQRRKETVG